MLIGYTKGICTTYCHKVLKEGDKVTINGPYGDFYYHDEDYEITCALALGHSEETPKIKPNKFRTKFI